MDKERLTILRAEMAAQAMEIEGIYGNINDRKREEGRAVVESVGYQLHNLYCAFEDLFKIVAKTFENHIEDKSKYHVELLKRMTIRIEKIRPSLLSRETYVLLDDLRSFRHFFRHAYSYELDERKVKLVLDDVERLKEIYRKDIDLFLNSFL